MPDPRLLEHAVAEIHLKSLLEERKKRERQQARRGRFLHSAANGDQQHDVERHKVVFINRTYEASGKSGEGAYPAVNNTTGRNSAASQPANSQPAHTPAAFLGRLAEVAASASVQPPAVLSRGPHSHSTPPKVTTPPPIVAKLADDATDNVEGHQSPIHLTEGDNGTSGNSRPDQVAADPNNDYGRAVSRNAPTPAPSRLPGMSFGVDLLSAREPLPSSNHSDASGQYPSTVRQNFYAASGPSDQKNSAALGHHSTQFSAAQSEPISVEARVQHATFGAAQITSVINSPQAYGVSNLQAENSAQSATTATALMAPPPVSLSAPMAELVPEAAATVNNSSAPAPNLPAAGTQSPSKPSASPQEFLSKLGGIVSSVPSRKSEQADQVSTAGSGQEPKPGERAYGGSFFESESSLVQPSSSGDEPADAAKVESAAAELVPLSAMPSDNANAAVTTVPEPFFSEHVNKIQLASQSRETHALTGEAGDEENQHRLLSRSAADELAEAALRVSQCDPDFANAETPRTISQEDRVPDQAVAAPVAVPDFFSSNVPATPLATAGEMLERSAEIEDRLEEEDLLPAPDSQGQVPHSHKQTDFFSATPPVQPGRNANSTKVVHDSSERKSAEGETAGRKERAPLAEMPPLMGATVQLDPQAAKQEPITAPPNDKSEFDFFAAGARRSDAAVVVQRAAIGAVDSGVHQTVENEPNAVMSFDHFANMSSRNRKADHERRPADRSQTAVQAAEHSAPTSVELQSSTDPDAVPKSKRTNRRKATARQAAADSASEASRSKADSNPSSLVKLSQNLSQKQMVMLTAAAMVLLIVIWQGSVGVLQPLFSAASQLTQPQELSRMVGAWQIRTVFNGANCDGQLQLQVENGKLIGQGQDSIGPYLIAGTVKEHHVQFEKRYQIQDAQGQPVLDKPILFGGTVSSSRNSSLYMKGTWYRDITVGYSWKQKKQHVGGEWEAQSTSVSGMQRSRMAPPGAAAEGDAEVLPAVSEVQTSPDPIPLQVKFTIAGIMVVLTCAGMLSGSLYMFGPGGKVNVWEKEKYIPSQFKGKHNKILKELAKPLKPGGIPLGLRMEWRIWKLWEAKELALPPETRKDEPHMLIIGASGKGKTRLVANILAHDIEWNDRALVLIDADGGLVDLIARWIAAHQKGREIAKRVIILDPTQKNGTYSYNPLEMPEDGDLQTAANSIVYGFKAIYTEAPGSQSQWNAQTANILRNAALLLIANGRTLTDLPRLLNDNDFRDILLDGVERKKDERSEYLTLLDTWGQYKKLARTDQWITWVEPILNRITPMLSDSRIRNIFTNPVSDIRLKDIILEKKILLVKVSKGSLDSNANLLGSLIVTGLRQAAISLSNQLVDKQIALYLDTFDSFVEKDAFDNVSKEMGLIATTNSLQHLPEDFRNQIILKTNTVVCFSLAKKDADLLGPQIFRVDGRKLKHQTMQNIFNKVNTSPQFEGISDEEKLNIDRVIGQDPQTFFAYRVGSSAGVFHLKSYDFPDVPDSAVKKKLLNKMKGQLSDRTKVVDREDPSAESADKGAMENHAGSERKALYSSSGLFDFAPETDRKVVV